MDYPVVIVPLSKDDGGGYLGFAPDLQGCMSDGESPEETLTNLRDAIAEWLDAYRRSQPELEVPTPGSAGRAVAKEGEHLSELIRAITAANAEIDDRIEELARNVDDIRDRIENIESWARFAAISGERRDPPATRATRHHIGYRRP